jgi:hypothetical protein
MAQDFAAALRDPQWVWEIITRDLPTLRAAVVVAKIGLVDENNTASGGT